MKKNTSIKIIISVVIIIALAAFIVNINSIIPQAPTLSQNLSGQNYSDCFSQSPDTLVFVYSNTCPHCQAMKPIVQELQQEGYKFYYAESTDPQARDLVTGCFGDLQRAQRIQGRCQRQSLKVLQIAAQAVKFKNVKVFYRGTLGVY